MTELDEHGRPEPPVAAGEVATLLGFLDYQRATLAWKCSGLDAAGLRATTAASTMTLGGILKHMALVEEYGWFSLLSAWPRVRAAVGCGGLEGRPRLGMAHGRRGFPEDLFALWQRGRGTVPRRQHGRCSTAVMGSVGALAKRTYSSDGRSPSLRWILCHMIEEYARHNGHADLLRESIDGTTGE